MMKLAAAQRMPESAAQRRARRTRASASTFGYKSDLQEHYELGDVLGAGSYGVVRAATQLSSGDAVAVKTIPKRRAGLSPQLQAAYLVKIRSEADTHSQMGASLDVLYLYDVFEDDQAVHLVLERASGGNLWASPALASGRFSEAVAADVMRSVLRAVAQCHARGVVFRDIKPENFLRTDAGTLKLSDFGLAARCSPGQLLKERCGTLGYTAPEVIGQAYSFPCDLWSAGCVAYQLLSGELPFRPDPDEAAELRPGAAGATKALFRAILFDSLDVESGVWATISPAAKDFVRRLIGDRAKDPALRMGAQEALAHAWVRPAGLASAAALDGTVLSRLQRFGVSGALHRSVLRSLAARAADSGGDNAELAAVGALFDSIAATVSGGSGGGGVSCDALVKGLQEVGYSASPTEWRQLLPLLDSQRTGSVTRADFVAALTDWRAAAVGEPRWRAWAAGAFYAFRGGDGGDGDPVDARIPADALLEQVCDIDWEAVGGAAVCREAVSGALRAVQAGPEGLSLDDWTRLLEDAGSDEALTEFDGRLLGGSP